MSHIVLTDEQARLLGGSSPVQVRDANGKLLGYFEPVVFTPEDIVEAKRRAALTDRWYSGEEVRDHLRALERAEKHEGPMDKKRLHERLKDIRSQEGE